MNLFLKTRLFLIFILFSPVVYAGGESYLSVELSEDLSLHDFNLMKLSENGTASSPEDYDAVRNEAIRVLLAEAQWIFSGMIYGFEFRYVPGASNLDVEDEFYLTPKGQIPSGDPSLRAEKVWDDYRTLTVQFVYWLTPGQQQRIQQFHMSSYSAAGGSASVSVTSRSGGRDSLQQGTKQALREDLRQRFYNRPREISGILCFSHPPKLTIGSGSYNSYVRILYRIDDLKEYPSR